MHMCREDMLEKRATYLHVPQTQRKRRELSSNHQLAREPLKYLCRILFFENFKHEYYICIIPLPHLLIPLTPFQIQDLFLFILLQLQTYTQIYIYMFLFVLLLFGCLLLGGPPLSSQINRHRGIFFLTNTWSKLVLFLASFS